jgi:polysaccharide biosynthesis/export protein
MKKNLLLIILQAGLALLLLTGCQHPGPQFDPYALAGRSAVGFQGITLTNQINPAWLRPPTAPFTLGPGDQIELEMMEDSASTNLDVVGPDGKIYFDLLPGLDVWGLTLPQTEALIEKQLSQYVRNQPRVSVTLRGVESRKIWMLGRLQSPGVYFMTNAMTLLEAVALAGGTLDLAASRDLGTVGAIDSTADLRRSFIVRKGELLPVDMQRLIAQGDLSQNIYLEPDDFIYFPPLTARNVYVIGAVGQPRAVPYLEGMTMVSAIASASGTIREAYLSHVAVVRGSLAEPKVAIVDFKDVIRGRVPDVLLQPQDIVYVPFEPYRYLRRYVNLIMDTFVSSVAINAGVRAVSPNSSSAAGVFIPLGSRITVTPTTGAPATGFVQ